MLVPGVRVVRGPDWSWGSQDGGEGHVGTVCEIGRSGTMGTPDKTVVVQWDLGKRTNYRVDYLGLFDLRVIDNAQIGVKHPNIACDNCATQGISGMRYKCLICSDFDLCYTCYHNDKHDLSHSFRRFDTATALGVDLPVRRNGRKCDLKGCFVGATVVRGFNWEWANQDGGDGKTGTILEIRGWDNESCRSVAIVAWLASGKNNVYRLGHKGDCDVKCVEVATSGQYYPEHLPILGQPVEQAIVRDFPHQGQSPRASAAQQFSVGDKVKAEIRVHALKAMQHGHGGWNPKMAEYIGQIGTVHRVTDKGDIRVQFEGCQNRWTFNPLALTKISCVAVGDVVCLRSDLDQIRELQKGHGEWTEDMKNSLGKLGKVLKIYSDGDLRVQLDGHTWTLNPQCVRLVPGSATELANTMQASQNQRQEPSMMWQPGSYLLSSIPPAGNVADQLVRSAAQGRLECVRELLEVGGGAGRAQNIDVRSEGKTALQVAAHQGHTAIVRFLLEAGSNIATVDADGDTCLHYAAFGNQPEVVQTLIEAGINVDIANRSGCTALHISAHKQPTKCVELLLAAGANPNLTDSYGDTALHDAIGKDNATVIDLLTASSRVDLTVRNKRGFNALHHAALKGKAYAAQRILAQARQLVDVKKEDGFAALHLAALNGHRDVCEVLLSVGRADVDVRNNRKQTPLLLAISQGHCAIVEALVRRHCNVCVADEDGDTALHVLFMKRDLLMRIALDAHDAPAIYAICAPLMERTAGAATASLQHPISVAVACYLVEYGADAHATNLNGQTAFSFLGADAAAIHDVVNSYQVSSGCGQLHIDGCRKGAVHSGGGGGGGGGTATTGSYNLNESPMRRNSSGGGGGASAGADEAATSATSSKASLKLHQHHHHHHHHHKRSRDGAHQQQQQQHTYVNETVAAHACAECMVCSELSQTNVTLEPCGHRIACEECSARMRKCLQCGETVERRVACDGRTILLRQRQPSAERVRQLETRIAEIEESNACTICMEHRRNVIFLCGHGACAKCADTLKICHMCRKTITRRISIY